jgi:hypothetical protein
MLGAIIGFLAVIFLVYGMYFHPRPAVYKEGFEEDFGGWKSNADVPLDPNNPSSFVEWNVSRVNSPVKSGQYSVELYVDGRQDDGTVWIEKKFSARENARIYVDVSFDFYSETESWNVLAVVVGFAGARSPQVEEDFTVLSQANEVEGWKLYSHTATLETDSSGEAWVAIGISVRWETYLTYNIDNLKVTIS